MRLYSYDVVIDVVALDIQDMKTRMIIAQPDNPASKGIGGSIPGKE